jgi:uncharacterized protein involved in exopolysaccharide biosynthesis/Mrp family chromosome partitioning ATPase
LLGLLIGWLAILVWPKSYTSEAKLMMRVGRESVSLDPTATTSATLMLQKTREEEIVTALEMLSSRQIAEMVVDELGTGAILSGELPPDEASNGSEGSPPGLVARVVEVAEPIVSRSIDALNAGLLYVGIKSPLSNRELAIRQVLGSIEINSPLESRVVNIEASAKTPKMAQAIARTVTESFLSEHLDASLTAGSLEFFQHQTRDLEKRLNDLVHQRSEYMQDNKIVSIEANRELLREKLSEVERDLVSAYGGLEQAIAESQELQVKTDQLEDEIIAERLEAEDLTWSGMRQQIYELELQEQHASALYTDKHPRLRRIRKQLVGAREILGERKSDRVDLNTTPNPVKLDLNIQLQKQQSAVAGLKFEIDDKERRRASMQQEIDRLLAQEKHLTKLDRDILLAERKLIALEEKLEEARVIDELHKEKISAVEVFQPANFIERAASPNKKLLAAGFLFLGLSAGLFLSVLKEGASPKLTNSKDVESQLLVPVIADIPRISRMSSPRPRDKRLVREKCQALITDLLLSKPRQEGSRGRSLGIISVDAGSGASTLAANLAATASMDCQMRTVVVDADSRQRSISKVFGLNGSPGLVELLRGSASADECLQKVEDSSVEVVSSAADSCDAILASSAHEIVQALQAYLMECDLMIVDLPAANQPDQAVALAQHLDSVLVVIESEHTELASAERLLRRLAMSETEVVGVVLNKTRDYLPKVVRSFVG